jgi:hypothetical protein
MPNKLGLELMAIVGPHLADPEGEPGNDAIDEGDRIGLGVPVVDLDRPDAGRIIDVDLDLMAGDLLLIVLGVDLANPGWRLLRGGRRLRSCRAHGRDEAMMACRAPKRGLRRRRALTSRCLQALASKRRT